MHAQQGLSRSEFNDTTADRFQRHCGAQTENGCIPWTSQQNKRGYGVFRLGGRDSKRTSAHRVSWVIKNGDLEPGIMVLHRCDNPSCVNPNHLFIGSAKQNTEDMVAKDRHPWRDGTPWQKLDAQSVERIRELRAAGHTQQNVADLLGVSRPLISMIEHGKLQYAQGMTA
jgi:hypothetical protein